MRLLPAAMTKPRFFTTSADFRDWLAVNAASAAELLVGFYKVGSGRPSMSWPESVDEALCVGWIDGVRKRIDDQSYQIRFTPRKATSIWSAVNIAKFEQLRAQGRITEAGARAFAHRKHEKSVVYAYEQETTAELSPQELQSFKHARSAWAFFVATPPSYKKVVLHWVTTAKRPDTRAARLASLVQACAAGVRLR